MSEELKKDCPFCGSSSLDCDGHSVNCQSCGSEGPCFFPTPEREKAIEGWNRRANAKTAQEFNVNHNCGNCGNDISSEDAPKVICSKMDCIHGSRWTPKPEPAPSTKHLVIDDIMAESTIEERLFALEKAVKELRGGK